MNMVTTMKTTMLIMMGWPDAIPAPEQGSLIANKHMRYGNHCTTPVQGSHIADKHMHYSYHTHYSNHMHYTTHYLKCMEEWEWGTEAYTHCDGS